MSVDVEEFERDPATALRSMSSFRKDDWWALVRHFRLEVEPTARKKVLCDAVMQHLRAAGLIDAREEEVEGGERAGGAVAGGGLSEERQLAMRRLELEYEREEARLRREYEKECAERQAELRREERAHELQLASMNGARGRENDGSSFYKARGLVPKFNEHEPEDFFSAFEQVATTLQWDEEKWALLAQSAFPEKAQSAYLALDSEERNVYERVKEEVLRAYEVTPEHYRSKFRSVRKMPGRRFAEYAHELDKSLTKWWKALGADTLEKVKEAVLLEQFLQGVATEVKIYLRERRVCSVKEAASLAEDFVLLSKQGRELPERSWRGTSRPRWSGSESGKMAGKPTRCLKCGSASHVAWQCGSSRKEENGGGGATTRAKCFRCGQVGHISPECPQTQTAKKGKSTGPSACVAALANVKEQVQRQKEEEKEMHGYDHYIRAGHVVLGEGGKRVPVRILRDSGTEYNLVLRSVLPNVERKGGMRMKGVGGVVDAHLIEVSLEVDSWRIRAKLAVVDELPIQGVEVLLGNTSGGRMEMVNFLGDEAEEVGVCDRLLQVPEQSEVKEEVVQDGAELLMVETVEPEVMSRRQQKEQQSRYLGEVESFFSIPQTEETREVVKGTAAVTRAMAKQRAQQEEVLEGVGDLFSAPQIAAPAQDTESVMEAEPAGLERPGAERDEGGQRVEVRAIAECGEGSDGLPPTRPELIQAQREDPDLASLWSEALRKEEAEEEASCFYVDNGLLKRKWRKPHASGEDHQNYHQIVLPSKYRRRIIQTAHEETAAHLGAKKSGDAILSYFFWKGLKRDVADYVRGCHVCQVCERQTPVRAPLQPIPVVGEPFEKVVVDVVGPLPRTSAGNEYLLTLMCTATRYADAIPMSSCKARKIVPKIVDIFSKFGMPKVIQSDRGSNFMGKFFQRALSKMGVTHVTSTAYHPQSQGCLERFHGTLKGILTKFCLKNDKDWDEGVQIALYAIRTARHEGLGYSPFELLFGRKPRENLRLMSEGWEAEDEPVPLADYVTKLRDRMKCAHDLARSNLEVAQGKMKAQYDKRSKHREFKSGDLVLLFDSTACRPLQAKYRGPYVVLRRLGPVNYLLSTPGRRQESKAVHVNLLKPYQGEMGAAAAVGVDTEEVPEETVPKLTPDFSHSRDGPRLANSQARLELGARLGHLKEGQKDQLLRLLDEFSGVMDNTPTRTHLLKHDVTLVEGAKPVRQYPYRLSPEKKRLMRQEVKYLLDNGLAVPSTSPWASPCILVEKEDGTPRLCTDYRRLNQVTVEDPYPMKRIDDLLDEVSAARFLTSLDLLKGFWQVSLTDRAQEASAFVTPDGHYSYCVMPFGMRNSSATFQCLVDRLVSGLEGVTAYIDDLLVYSNTWEEHVERLRALFSRLLESSLTINLAKCEFGASTVKYLGHRVGFGGIRPLEAKVADILNFEAPKTRKGLRSFLGLIGFYRRFCRDFAHVASPLTDLLSERRTWKWSPACEKAFKGLKALLSSTPILHAPDYEKPFVVYVDASESGIGGMLGQECDGIVKPVAYMSKKLLKHQKGYSVIEKEALGLIKCLEKFEVYLGGKVTVFSDHNPLKFLESMKMKNARLARWALLLQDKNIVIQHVPGKENVVADALSRPN